MVIKVDIDSVIRDTPAQMLMVYNNSIYAEKKLSFEDLKSYDVNVSFPGLTNAEDFFFNLHAETVFVKAKCCKNAKEGLQLLKDKGATIRIVSLQYKHNMLRTIQWLVRNAIPFDELCFVESKDSVDGDVLIDDCPQNLYKCVGKREICYCLNAPWNKDGWSGHRANDLLEFAQDLIHNFPQKFGEYQ